jgi:hypothetical protein
MNTERIMNTEQTASMPYPQKKLLLEMLSQRFNQNLPLIDYFINSANVQFERHYPATENLPVADEYSIELPNNMKCYFIFEKRNHEPLTLQYRYRREGDDDTYEVQNPRDSEDGRKRKSPRKAKRRKSPRNKSPRKANRRKSPRRKS